MLFDIIPGFVWRILEAGCFSCIDTGIDLKTNEQQITLYPHTRGTENQSVIKVFNEIHFPGLSFVKKMLCSSFARVGTCASVSRLLFETVINVNARNMKCQ